MGAWSTQDWIDFTNKIFIGSLILGAISAFSIAVTSWLIIKWQDEIGAQKDVISAQKDAALEKYKTDAGVQIAQAGKAGDEAKAEATKANERIAQANERAAQLENEAQQARLGQEKLKAQLAWRTLSPEQAGKIIARLSTEPHFVKVAYVANDPESLFFAIQFCKIFTASHWRFITSSDTYSTQLIIGLVVPDLSEDPSAPVLLRDALRDANIPFSTGQIPGPDMSVGGTDPTVEFTFMVGSKAPAF